MPKHLLLDFSLVAGVDISAVETLIQVDITSDIVISGIVNV
jgi:hypothetical protein